MAWSNGALNRPNLSMDEANKIIALIERHPLCAGEKWYLICMSWWKLFVDAVEKNKLNNLPPIDNTSIMDEDGAENGQRSLKYNLLEKFDYILVPEQAFGIIKEQFGFLNGDGDIIERLVVLPSLNKRNLQIEIYPLVLKVAKASATDDMKTLVVSVANTFDELKQFALEALNVEKDNRIDFYLRVDDTFKKLNSSEKDWFNLIAKDDLFVIDELDANGVGVITGKNTLSLRSRNGTYAQNGSISTGKKTLALQPGVVGMQNLGNTCFMNSALQCLCNVPEVRDYFISGKYLNDLNQTNPLGMQGHLASVYSELVEQVWNGRLDAVILRKFKIIIGQFAPRFSGYNQQDSQEMLSFLLDGLHEDLNRIKMKPYLEESESDGRPDKIAAEEAWNNYRKRNDSVIVENIHGQLKSTVTCPVCRKVSVKFDPFCFLSVPIPEPIEIKKMTVIFVPRSKQLNWTKFIISLLRPVDMRQIKELICDHLNVKELPILMVEIIKNDVARILDDDILITDPSNFHGKQIFAWQLNYDQGKTSYVIHVRNILQNERAVTIPMFYSCKTRKEVTKSLINEEIVPQIRDFFIDWNKGKKLDEIDDDSGSDSFEEARDCVASFSVEYSNFLETKSRNSFSESLAVDWQPADKNGISGMTISLIWDKNIFNDYHGQNLVERFVNAPLGQLPGVSVHDCIDSFTKEEELSDDNLWYCSHCREHRHATKKLDIWNLPQILILHLKRFQFSRWCRQKVDTMIQVPTLNLNLNQKVISGTTNNIYNLISISNHFGCLGSGHYTAWALKNGRWYDLNDSYVMCLGDLNNPIASKDAYMLFYRRQSPNVDISQVEPNIEMETDD